MQDNGLVFSGVSVLTPQEIIPKAQVIVRGNKIASISEKIITASGITLPLEEHILLPALINSHDHLVGTWYPKLGYPPYNNWYKWDVDFKKSDLFQERKQVSTRDLYLLGSYKQIFAGVTTVSDHIFHEFNTPYISICPIRVLEDYTLVHAVSSFALQWGDGIVEEHTKANGVLPFILHINEGFDEETRGSLKKLHSLGALTNVSVLVHGISFDEEDIRLIAQQKANVIWCPDSNHYMYNSTTNIKGLLEAGINVGLGTDSCITGSINLLEEISYAKKLYYELYQEDISDKTLVEMVTINASRALQINSKLGSIEENKLADLLIIPHLAENPYTSVTKAKPEDITLLLKAGHPLFGDLELWDILKLSSSNYTQIKIKGHNKFIIGNPLALKKRVQEAIGYEKELPFLPF